MTFHTRRALMGAASLLAVTAFACSAAAQDMGAMAMPPAPATETPDPHAGHDMSAMSPEDSMDAMPGMTSALGPWSMARDAGGTAWQPETAGHGGVHSQVGDWMVMSHAQLNLVYANQDGPRGDSKAFLAGMVMTMAQREWGQSRLQVRAMLSPDPFMGKSGYPLLLAAGETANGTDPLVDRQHPHDLFMELSASYAYSFGKDQSLFVYAGLPGEPAFGPPAFMHRKAASDSPEAPISHHWMDSTHITFGVVTAGYAAGPFKLEASAFRGREPDQNRFDIETGALDSASLRFSYNPGPDWALQASWASITSPEALEPDDDERRLSLSALYSHYFGGVRVNGTAAWARKDKVPGDTSQAWLLEASVEPNDHWTIFARAEQVDQDELTIGAHHGPQYTVRKASLGAIYDWRLGDSVKLGLGALVNAYDIPGPLSAAYGDTGGGMAFIRLKIE